MYKKELTYAKAYAIIVLGGALKMTNTNITNFRKNVYEMIENTIEYNEPICISTKKGNAIVISEEEYNNMVETLYIESVPGLKEDLLKAKDEPDSEFVDEDKVEW